MTGVAHKLEKWLPHRDPLILLDDLVKFGDNEAISKVCINEKTLFLENGKVPAWIGIEYMAQTIALYSGNISYNNSEPVTLGFLLGARKYKSWRESFMLGETLEVVVTPQLIDGAINNFKCSIFIESELVASAALTAYKPTQEMIEDLKA